MKKVQRSIVCPFGPIAACEGEDIQDTLRRYTSKKGASSYAITPDICEARRQKGYYAGCQECEWRLASASRPARSPIQPDRKGTKVAKLKRKMVDCPQCERAHVVDKGSKGKALLCPECACAPSQRRQPVVKGVKQTRPSRKPAAKEPGRKPQRQPAGKGTRVPYDRRRSGAGDDVAMELLGCKDLQAMVVLAKKYGIQDAGKYVKSFKAGAMNAGNVRMAIGNRIRGVVRRRETTAG